MEASNEKTMLALREASTEVAEFFGSVTAEVNAIKEKYGSIVPDAETKDGYAFCKAVRAEVMPIKTGIEKARKSLKDPVLAMGKTIDGSAKPLMETLESTMRPFIDAYQEVDNRKKRLEEERQAKIQAAFDAMNDAAMNAIGQTSLVIETIIDDIACYEIDREVFKERADEAVNKHHELMGKLEQMLSDAKAGEEMKRQQEDLAARQAEIERKEREQREAEQQAAQEKREREIAEQAAADAKLKAEQEAVEAEERHAKQLAEAKAKAEQDAIKAKEEAEQKAEAAALAERQRIEAEQQAEQEAAEAREKDRKHKAGVHNAILTELLTTGITEKQAKAVISLAAKRKAGNMYIQY